MAKTFPIGCTIVLVSNEWIFLYGPPGAGKSSLARRLAQQLELPHVDLDECIARQAGQSIAQIFAAQGEAGFRQRERAALADVLRQPPGCVALGGGALLDDHTRKQVQSAGQVLCLSAPFDALLARLQAESASAPRPLLHAGADDAAGRLQSLLQRRAAHYASFPLQLETGGADLETLAWQAQVQLGMFHVSGMGAAYDVRVVEGGLASLGQMLQQRGLQSPITLVSDEHVAQHYAAPALESLRQAGYTAALVAIPAGEAHKTIETVNRLWAAFLELGLERSSTVIALGGGVVGDLAGFAAATYLRGIPWVVVPTSLLAMADASLGGKTGADLPQGKNLVGAFHPPRLALADPSLLATLPRLELINGLAEVIKQGVLGDPALFALCAQGLEALHGRWGELVRRAMAVKVQVILEDPYERGRRASLNLGHTLGHALELVSDFRLRHGEAVAIGMLAAARLSEHMHIAAPGLAQQLADALQRCGLPTSLPPDVDRARLLAAMQLDKKKAAGKVRFVLPERIGAVRWDVEIPDLEMILLPFPLGRGQGG